MKHTFGEFLESIPETAECLTLSFSPSTGARKQRWSNYGLSADFLGDYFANFFLGDVLPDSQAQRQQTIKAAISYVANELLENAIKYEDQRLRSPVEISLYLYEEKIIFLTSNFTNAEIADRFQTFVQELLSADLDQLYMQRLEQAASGNSNSGIGILTLLNDYSVRLGWQFEALDHHPEMIKVTVMAQLAV